MKTGPPPKDGLRARMPGFELRATEGAEMPVLTGHFLRFNEWTEISSLFEGTFMERILPGAAKKTLKENREQFRILFQHGRDPYIGMKPLAKPEVLEEDSEGVKYEGELFNTEYNRELIPGLENGQYGASFKFRVVKEEFDEEPTKSKENPNGLPERTIKEIQLYEGGPVTFGAYAGATAEVKEGGRSITDEVFIADLKSDPTRYPELDQLFRSWVDVDPDRVLELIEHRGAIGYQKTSTSDGAWDGPANEKRLPSPMSLAKMKEAYAWMDSAMVTDGMCPKTAGKFIHHEVADGGNVSAANLTACSAGIAVLNGGRGGTVIPSGDRKGVYNHLSKHLKDGGKEPPPLRSLDELEDEPQEQEIDDVQPVESEEKPAEETQENSSDVTEEPSEGTLPRKTALLGAESKSHSARSRAMKGMPPWGTPKKATPPWRKD